jgi:hypothetical protein
MDMAPMIVILPPILLMPITCYPPFTMWLPQFVN